MVKYTIVDVKQQNDDDSLSFCVVVNEDPAREGQVFVYENVTFAESEDGSLECGVNMTKLIPGSGILQLEQISDDEQQFMQDLLMQLVEDFVTDAVARAEEANKPNP